MYSTHFADLILRCGAEAENCAKAILSERSAGPPASSFPKIQQQLIGAGIDLRTRKLFIRWPFQSLTPGTGELLPFALAQPSDDNPLWFTAYNGVKHKRLEKPEVATYWHLVCGVGAVFVLNLLLRADNIRQVRDNRAVISQRAESYSEFFSAEFIRQKAGSGTTSTLTVHET